MTIRSYAASSTSLSILHKNFRLMVIKRLEKFRSCKDLMRETFFYATESILATTPATKWCEYTVNLNIMRKEARDHNLLSTL